MSESYSPAFFGFSSPLGVLLMISKLLSRPGVLKATNERQDNGADILHQVAHFPIDQVHFMYIQGAHATLSPRKTQRDKVLVAKNVGLYVPLNPPPLAQRGS